jgi:hypothetical protein
MLEASNFIALLPGLTDVDDAQVDEAVRRHEEVGEQAGDLGSML